MKVQVKTLDNKSGGELELADAIFGLPTRKDILHRMVEWQRAKKQAGTHKTKGESEVSGTGKKPFKQKGTGSARAGTKRAPQHRGGATIFGPVVRSHAYDMPKKLRKLALKIALSSKQTEGKLVVLDKAELKDAKTKTLVSNFKTLGFEKALIIGGAELNEPFAQAARNIKHINVLPVQGANVYDILRHDTLVLTRDAVKALEERLV